MKHHLSDLMVFARCEKEWEYSSHWKQNRQPAIIPYPLFFGIAAHYYYEHMHEGWAAGKQAVMDYQDRNPASLAHHGPLEDIIDKIFWHVQMLSPKVSEYEVITREEVCDFYIGSVPSQTRFDRIVRNKLSGVWYIEDLKTTKHPERLLTKLQFNDLQRHMLQYAFCQKYPDREFGGTIYTIVNSKPPDNLTPLKSGMLSKDLSIHASDLWFWHKAARYHKITKAEVYPFYKDVIDHLKGKRGEFLTRTLVRPDLPRQRNAIQTIDILAAKAHMFLEEYGVATLPTGLAVYGQCDNCPFFQPCFAERAGEKASLVDFPVREGYIR